MDIYFNTACYHSQLYQGLTHGYMFYHFAFSASVLIITPISFIQKYQADYTSDCIFIIANIGCAYVTIENYPMRLNVTDKRCLPCLQ